MGSYKNMAYGFGYIQIKKLIVFFALVITVLTGSAIAHGDTSLYTIQERQLYAYTVLISLLLMLALMIIYKQYNFSREVLIPIVYCLIVGFDVYGSISSDHLMDIGYTFIRLSLLIMLTSSCRVILFKWYRKILIIMASVGIVCFFLYLLHIPLFYDVVNYYSGVGSGAYYINYKVCFLFSEGSTLRLCGLFNEPGYFGTILALILCAENFNMRRRGNIILVIAGCLTFSVAFFFLCIIHFVLLTYKKPKLFMGLIIMLLIYLFILPMFASGDGAISTFISRIIISDNGIEAARRSNNMIDIMARNLFISEKFVFGYGNGYIASLNFTGGISTIKTYFIEYGVVGALLIYGTPFVLMIKRAKLNSYAINLIICVFASAYQRPDIFIYPYFVILLGGIDYIAAETERKKVLGNQL